MKKTAFILCMSFLYLSCSNSEEFNSNEACGVNNLIKDLAWLKKLSTELDQNEYSSKFNVFYQSFENNETLFINANCFPNCSSVYPVYNCSGEIIGAIGDDKFSLDLLSSGKVIWKSKDNKCEFSPN